MNRRKLTITSITTILACVTIAGVFGLSSWFGKSGTGFSSTLLPEWKYRRAITLSGQTSNLTDYQVKIELPASLTSSLVTDGKLQSVASNFADIRFTDANDNQLLNFWIETATTTATSTIWVKVPGLSANKSSTIYMYYGNPSATSASNGTNTFEFFDDFEGTSINTSKWTIVDATGWSVANGELRGTNTSGRIESIQTFSAPISQEVKAKAISCAGTGQFIAGFRVSTSDFCGIMGPTDGCAQARIWYAPPSTGDEHAGLTITGFYSLIQIIGKTTTAVDAYWKRYDTGAEITSWLNKENTISAEPIVLGKRYSDDFTGLSYDIYWDWVRVRKYASPEPTATVGSEQTQMTPVAHWRFDEGTGAIAYNATKKVAETNKWTKRRALSISNSGSTAQTNYQTKIELTPNNFDYSQVKTDGSDIRFVDSNGTELNYWLETWTTSATSTFWVKIPSLPGNTTSTIYIYYGNPSASSASNGANTFEFFDDFDTLDTSKWTVTGDGVSATTDDGLNVVQITSTDTAADDITSISSWGTEHAVRTKYKTDHYNSDSYLEIFIFHTPANSYGIHTYPCHEVSLMGRISLYNGAHNLFSLGTYWSAGAYHIQDNLHLSATNNKVLINGNTVVDSTVNIGTANKVILVRTMHAGAKIRIDWILVRKYASPEPSVTAVGSQEFGAGSKWSPDAAWISGATWTTGKFNSGLKFDGIDDYVNFGDINF